MRTRDDSRNGVTTGTPPFDSVENLTFLFQQTGIGIVFQDAGGRIQAANPVAEKMLGLTLEQLKGRTSIDPRWRAIHEDGSPFPGEDHPAMESLQTGRSILNKTMGVFHPLEGRTRWLHVSTTPLVRPGEVKPYQVMATFVDITDRVEAEARTREVEQQLLLFVENTPAAIALFDNHMNYLSVSNRWLEDYRLPLQSVIGRNHYDLFPDLPQRWKDIHQRCLAGATEKCDEDPFPRSDGTTDWVRWEIKPWRRSDGTIGGLILFSEVLTRQKETAAALVEQEEQYRLLFEQSLDAIFLTEPSGRVLEANPAACRMFGWSLEEFREMDRNSLIDRSDPRLPDALAERARTGGWRGELGFIRRDGSKLLCELSSTSFLDHHGKPRSNIVARDITERRRFEDRLKASEALFSRVFHSAPLLGALSMKADGRIVEANERYCRTLGFSREELLGRTTVECGIIGVQERDRIISVLADGSMSNLEFEMKAKDGTAIPCLGSLAVIEADGKEMLLSLFTDLSEIKRAAAERTKLELELHHLQKLESLGRLAGGVAHDMNNILGAILAVTEVMRIQHAGSPDTLKAVALVDQAATRGRDLVKSLVGFTRKELAKPEDLDVNELVRQEMSLLDRTLLKKYDLIMALGDHLPPVLGEPGALGSALMNLCVNAVDAMPDGGTLRIATRLAGASFVEIRVEDTGEGMTQDVLSRAMEPFFTTKPMGKGTGLGLAQVFNTTRAHGGYFNLESEPGKGTRAVMGFPCQAHAPAAPAVPEPGPGMQGLDILLVDDEELIRSTVPVLLGCLGHRVTSVAGCREALDRLAEGNLPDLVILDMNMPEFNGLETLQRIREHHKDLRILIATGFLEKEVEAALAGDDRVGALTKPYSLSEFQVALRQFKNGTP